MGVPFQGNSLVSHEATQHSVHPTGGTLRVFRDFVWLGVGSVKMAFSRPTHQRVTQTVGRCSKRGESVIPYYQIANQKLKGGNSGGISCVVEWTGESPAAPLSAGAA
jgi:hypothetical protein